MIIRRLPDALLCIAQPDHAALSADLMAAWQLDGLPDHPRRDAILLATREHDNGWLEEDAAAHVDREGEPLDFMAVPPAVKQRIWPRAAARLGEGHPYAGALVAQHALSLLGQQDTEPAWRPFLQRMKRLQAELLARCDEEAATTIPDDYRFVQAGDHLSLVFCNGWTPPFPRPGGRIQLRGDDLLITPDPFRGRRIPISVPARRLIVQRFNSSHDLRVALATAPLELMEGTAAGA